MSFMTQNVPTFGAATEKDAHGAGDCLSFEERPPTPDRLRRFRDSFHEPGLGRSHYGTANDSLPNVRFGHRVVKTEHASHLLGVGSTVSRTFGQPREVDTVGRSIPRSTLPDHVDPTSPFGRVTSTSESSKNLIFPIDETPEEDSHNDLYKRSHASYAPGEQRQRNYEWGSTTVQDPSSFRFGVRNTSNGATGDCLRDVTADTAQIISLRDRHHRKLTQSKIGKSRRGEVDPTMVFGKVTRQDEWDAAACLHGNYSAEDQQSGSDVGRSTRPGFRNVLPDGAPIDSVVFGGSKARDEVSAVTALKPSVYAEIGVSRADFDTLMSREELQEVVMSSGVCRTVEDFERLFELAKERHADDIQVIARRDRVSAEGMCSLDLFKMTLFEDFRQSYGGRQ